jgi:transcriptional regulator with XRE-family HTH domain
MTTFGERFKKLREEKGLSQIEIAKIIGIGNSTVSQYESGKRIPDHDTLDKIADFFHVTVDYLRGRSEVRTEVLTKDEERIYKIIGDSGDITPEEWKKIFDNFELIVEGIKAQRKK